MQLQEILDFSLVAKPSATVGRNAQEQAKRAKYSNFFSE
jgi:hypothetical protein